VTTRRDLLVGALCLGGAGAAYALEPRRRVSLLGRRSLASIVPYRFGHYTARDVTDLIAPREDSLAAALYGQTVGRVYSSSAGGPEIMMLLAYGDTQDVIHSLVTRSRKTDLWRSSSLGASAYLAGA